MYDLQGEKPKKPEMETILEQQRRYHEERERIIKLMVDEYVTKKPSVRFIRLGYVYSQLTNKMNILDFIFGTGKRANIL